MFTGIIQEQGQVSKLENKNNGLKIWIKSSKLSKGAKKGQSIAVNGVCLTVDEVENKSISFDISDETLKISNFKNLEKDHKVNLEPSLKLSDSLDGHLVQGHVDAVGTVTSITKNQDQALLTIEFPENIADYLAFKGSITVNGVSLTIAKLNTQSFTIQLIPITLQETNLGILKKNDKVNLETDMIARYLERLIKKKDNEAKYSFLKERGFL